MEIRIGAKHILLKFQKHYLEDAFHCCLIINFLGKRVDNMYVTSLRYRDIETTKDKSI